MIPLLNTFFGKLDKMIPKVKSLGSNELNKQEPNQTDPKKFSC